MNQEKEIADQLLAQFFPLGEWSLYKGTSGMNNTTLFVECRDKKYVLRIYDTHQEESRVGYEHEILLALKDMPLPFHTPVPVFSHNGNTILRTSGGKLAALFHFIDGTNPQLNKLAEINSFGEAVGQLSCAFEKMQLDLKPVYRPYYEIENTHPRCSPEEVIKFCSNPPDEFSQHTHALTAVGNELAAFQDSIGNLRELPHQLIHGDLNPSNVLSGQNGEITAILDFEFVTNDLRVMELAVCLSDLINSTKDEELLWSRIRRFLDGYGKYVKLTTEETNSIPLLVLLRRLDVFIHFLGRYMDGVDKVDIVVGQTYNAASQIEWMEANRGRLVELCRG